MILSKFLKTLFIVAAILVSSANDASALEDKKKPSKQDSLLCDPPNWWVGMQTSHLELLARGTDFTGLQQITTVGINVRLNQWKWLPNGQYIILDLDILDNCPVQNISFNFQFKNGKVLSLNFPLLQRSGYVPQGLNANDIMYMVYPDRFANENPDNDSVPGLYQGAHRNGRKTRHGGDLAGIAAHLDYIQSTGHSAIWLNPVLENNQPIDSYHGYATTHSYKIDARLGSNEQYQRLALLCHERKIKMVWDAIYNHWGNEHYLFKNIPDSNWFHFFPTFTKTNYRAETLMDPYASDLDKKLMSDGWFDTHMPDLNQQDPNLATYLVQNTIWWMEYAGIDAIRIDTYSYPDQTFMSRLNKAVKREFPSAFLFGETWVTEPTVQAWFVNDFKYNKDKTYLDGVTDFQWFFGVSKGLNENFGWEEGLRRMQLTLTQDVIYEHPENNVIFLDNHDLSRFFSVVGKDLRKWQAGIGLLMTQRGIPCTYYGTEYLFEGYTNPDDLVRQEFKGGWKGDSIDYFKQINITTQEREAFDFYTHLTQLRNKHQWGTMSLKQFVPEDNIYVYFRYTEKKTYMMVVNLGDKTNIDLSRFQEMLQKGTKMTSLISAKEYAAQGILDWSKGQAFDIFELTTTPLPSK
jgi:glycosidase